MARKQPHLDPPMTGWQRDLPAPNDLPESIHVTGFDHPPNHMDDIYLELPRSSLMWRGVMIWMGPICFLGCVFPVILAIAAWGEVSAIVILMAVMTAVFGFISGFFFLRMDIAPPLDEPIRFNRARRKVYVYRFHQCWWNPFSRKRWFVRPEVYDWDDLRAEEWKIYVPTKAYKYGVSIAVVKPGTNQVLDRFELGMSGETYWAMAQTFMQQGQQALPKFNRPPRDWNNEAPGMNLARRFAPKVQWPEAMDIESRTAP
ncbi:MULTISPECIES: DUF6708 domain-containing protein [unclassified Pseudoxanthomonas]|uniref:DUF6708 domain-containing protein n=1 Tax=unclassified Pseudoxanthomonas TaxID=2645906 RepID=UPI003077A46C